MLTRNTQGGDRFSLDRRQDSEHMWFRLDRRKMEECKVTGRKVAVMPACVSDAKSRGPKILDICIDD